MVHWENAQIKIRNRVIVGPLDLDLRKGESLGISGCNGTGKTLLARALAGQIPVLHQGSFVSVSVPAAFVSFQSAFGMRNGFAAYRQQRWNPIDPEAAPSVQEELNYSSQKKMLDPLIRQFNFQQHMNSRVIQLSNGEQRKLELIRVLAASPDLLVLDNAFNGLDTLSRQCLHEMLDRLIEKGHSIVLTGMTKEDFPVSLQQCIQLGKSNAPCLISPREMDSCDPIGFEPLPDCPRWNDSSFDELIAVNGLNLNYSDKTILSNISWSVHAGERWALLGPNGSGKTSLLNLIFADNPKAYGSSIRLFGKKRGSGESIWEIKKKIGFISPEMQQYLPPNQKVLDVVCSGLFDSEGLYIRPTTYQQTLARQWLARIGDLSWSDCYYRDLSASGQRLVLLARTLIKNPPLLLLDEPFQGLDTHNKKKVSLLLDALAKQTNCAMIWVTHHREELPPAFTRELQLNKGKTEYLGPLRKAQNKRAT